jgi:ATP-dependent Lon protease
MDRLEIIELTGYTTEEKKNIAKAHLLPKQLEEHGVKPEMFQMADEALDHIITHYTREAGVRDLNRKIAAVVRGSAERVLRLKPDERVVIQASDLDEILGAERHEPEVAQKTLVPGVATGLAWTPVGGDILFIEATLMPGTGKLILTGQLGDVMKESAQIAFSVIRSRMPQLATHLDFDKKDLHIHVPAGAIPKDGPSAGITMLMAMASLFTGKTLSPKIAMTGEVTLRGSVMPVGGIREKLVAAHRAGIETVYLSKRNERDLRDVPDIVKKSMRIIGIEDVGELLRGALNLDLPAYDPTTGLWGKLTVAPPVHPVA